MYRQNTWKIQILNCFFQILSERELLMGEFEDYGKVFSTGCEKSQENEG